ncbi:MAG: hypothetical protein KAT17_10425, partial [Candidatus Aminicenantes bacterium]|nr:hypothetical protein [Candidatus Aminicenantes bacterium]
MVKGRRYFLLPFFLLFCFFLFSEDQKIIFKGFSIQKPEILLKNILKGDVDTIKEILEESGFFRRVSVVSKNNSCLVTVQEYPRVKAEIIPGNTLYPKEEILNLLNIKTGIQFNAKAFNSGLNRFYKKTKKDGYTHLTVEKIRVKDDGQVEISINEGVLKNVEVKNNRINHHIVHHFFRSVINKPFNTRVIKYILEEMLLTGAFHKIDSEVKRENGQVILLIRVEKKRVNRMKQSLEYSTYGGFKVSGLINLIKRNNKIQFLDSTIDYFSQGKNRLFRLDFNHYDYRKQLSKNGLSTGIKFLYTSFSEIKDIMVRFKPAYSLFFFKNFSLNIFLEGGLTKNFSQESNAIIAEAGVTLSFHYRSPLDRTRLELLAERQTSLLENYNNFRFMTSFHTKFSIGELKLYGQVNIFTGDEFSYNYNLLLFDQMGILQAEQIFSRDSHLIAGEINSNHFWGLVKVGLFGQYFYDTQPFYLYGLNTFWNIRGIPLNIVL